MHLEKVRLIEEKYHAGILGWESVSEWQQQVGHGQAEFNKQKHMCPAVPLAFPWSGVWVANLGGAAPGRERALLTFIRAQSCWQRAPPGLRDALLHPLLALLEGGGGGDQACHPSPCSAGWWGGNCTFPLPFTSASAFQRFLEGFACVCLNSDSPKGAPAGEEQRCRHHLSPGSWPGCDKHFYSSPVATLLKALRLMYKTISAITYYSTYYKYGFVLWTGSWWRWFNEQNTVVRYMINAFFCCICNFHKKVHKHIIVYTFS